MIKQPSWAKDSYPTINGWRNGNEMLKTHRYTQEQVDEWLEANSHGSVIADTETIVESPIEPVVLDEDVIIDETPKPETLTEAPIVNTPLDNMTDNEKTNVLTDKKTKSKTKGVKKWLNKLKKT